MKMQSEMFGEITVRFEEYGKGIEHYYGMPFSNNGQWHIEQQIKKLTNSRLHLTMWTATDKIVEVNKVKYENFHFELRPSPSSHNGVWVLVRAQRSGSYSRDITDAARKVFQEEISGLFASLEDYEKVAKKCQFAAIESYKQTTRNQLIKGLAHVKETLAFVEKLQQ